MKALLFAGNSQSMIAEIPNPVPGPGEMLVQVRASAICGSERRAYMLQGGESGHVMPAQPTLSGHEMAGIIEYPGRSSNFRRGDHIVFFAFASCGHCYYCQNDLRQLCTSRRFISGTHAQYIATPESCCFHLPQDIPFDVASLLGGDTLGVANRAISQLQLEPGLVVLVSGAGPVGLGVIMMLRFLGVTVVVSDPSPFRREFARSASDANLAIDPLTQDIRKTVDDLTDGLGPGAVIECSGSPAAQRQALELIRCRGTVVFCGENYDGLTIVPSNHIIHKEVVLRGAFYFTAADFAKNLGYYRQGLDPAPLISHRVSLDDAPEAMALFMQGKTGKVIINPGRKSWKAGEYGRN